jgi:hypothetical protein
MNQASGGGAHGFEVSNAKKFLTRIFTDFFGSRLELLQSKLARANSVGLTCRSAKSGAAAPPYHANVPESL